MHFFQDMIFFIREHFFIEDFVKMLYIDFIFILNTVVNKSILKFKVLDDRWRNILNIVLVIKIMGLPTME